MTRKQRPIVMTQRDRALNHVRLALVASVAALVLGLAGLAVIFGEVTGSLERNLAHANADRAQVKIDLAEQQDALAKANTRLIEAGEKPVTPPVPGPQGTPGLPGSNGRPPTAAEIRDAVASYCAAVNECRGPAGQSVTRGQVAAAVSSYCDSRGQCRGPLGIAGRNGTDGTDGANGEAGPQGPQGPPPTDAQVLAAVSAFCADGRCRGDVGPQGPPGEPGPACPPGFHTEQRTVITDGGPESAVLCVADQA